MAVSPQPPANTSKTPHQVSCSIPGPCGRGGYFLLSRVVIYEDIRPISGSGRVTGVWTFWVDCVLISVQPSGTCRSIWKVTGNFTIE